MLRSPPPVATFFSRPSARPLRLPTPLAIPPKTSRSRFFRCPYHTSHASSQKIGIVGLPNVGKSLLFNALVGREAAQSTNRPFTTINPNCALAQVPDNRLHTLAELVSPKKVTPSFVQLIDIAGLIAGASEGKGLGNQFLSNIYAVNAILHVVRCFDDPSVSHVEGNTDPIRDIEIVHQEIISKDREILERIAKKVERGHGQLNHSKTKDVLERTFKTLAEGGMANRLKIGADQDEVAVLDSWNLLSAKPVLVCCNVDVRDPRSLDTAEVQKGAPEPIPLQCPLYK